MAGLITFAIINPTTGKALRMNLQSFSKANQLWDAAAATFDDEPDHGLRDPDTYRAWMDLMADWFPPPAAILDIGCGTGSLSVLLAGLGCEVTGIDFSPGMLVQASAKAQTAGQTIDFRLMDAANPQLGSRRFTAILCRHLLWALPEPAVALQRWVDHLSPGGRLVLIEGFWHTGSGMHAWEVVELLPASLVNVELKPLSDQSTLWGGKVTDERFAVLAHLPPPNCEG
jgi:SAM-dependent methyltransferase